jgi:hypothetical protein
LAKAQAEDHPLGKHAEGFAIPRGRFYELTSNAIALPWNKVRYHWKAKWRDRKSVDYNTCRENVSHFISIR